MDMDMDGKIHVHGKPGNCTWHAASATAWLVVEDKCTQELIVTAS